MYSQLNVLSVKLKMIRRQKNLTLHELSERCGISTATLSKIENGHLSPTYEKIIALAKGLAVDVSALFSNNNDSQTSSRRSVTRRCEGIPHHSPQYIYELLHADLEHKSFTPMIATIKAHKRSDFPRLHKHDGEEFLYVLSGQVVLFTEHYTPLTLNVGDSCYFDSSMGHVCISASEFDATVMWITGTVVFANQANC